MAFFESGIVQTTSPGTIAAMVWNPGNTSASSYGPLGSVPAASVFHDLQLVNQGTANVLLNMGSVSVTQGTSGILLAAGQTLVLQGYSGTVGTAGTVWANTGTVGLTAAIAAGMPSVVSVI